MATIKSTLALNDKMSTTFSSITKAMHSTLSAMKSVQSGNSNMGKSFDKANTDILEAEKALKQFDSGLNRTKNNLGSATTKANSFLKSLLGFAVIRNIFSMITGQLDSAISRFDTINNYPKVMANLGIGKAESTASINRLSEGLKGIPTTLDSAVLSVQRLTSVNNNIGASTEMFLALNNAILAGGASTEIQSSAIEQLSQAYSKGKMDMMEWRTLQMAMPAQLQQVAKAMNMSTNELGEGLRYGTISMNDFMKTMVQLNETGVDGFPSLAEQAKNATSGIKTSIANMKSAVTRGITSMITNINKGLESAGLPTISQIISNIGSGLEDVLTRAGVLIGQIIQVLSPVINVMKAIVSFVQTNWTIIEPILQAIVIVLSVYYTYTFLAKVGTQMLSAAFSALTSPIFWILLAIIAVVAALIYLWNTNDTVAYWMLFIWDALVIGVNVLKLGITMAFYSIILGALTMYQGFLGVKMGLQTAFYMVVLGAQTMALGFQGAFEAIVNAGIWMYNQIVGLLNKLGGSFSTLDYADFTSGTVDAISKTMGDYASSIAETYGEMTDVSNQINDISTKMQQTAYDQASNIQNMAGEFNATRDQRVQDRTKLSISGITSGIKDGIAGLGSSLTGSMDDLVSGISAPDSSGSRAIKTTTNDDLISDEDIQLLLDVATRDYKLNYQQVTPEITLTFGDIRETADVDSILDEVATKLEEIYDGNLEVS